MTLITPKIDKRGAKQIYEQAVKMARIYCPEWENISNNNPDEEDIIGVVLLKLFSKLTEIVIGQLNRIPEKHLLAFYDFIGIDHLPPATAKVPLTFKLSEGSKSAFVPERTKVASSEDPTVVFETIEPLTVINFKIEAAYSLNPWDDKYTNHILDINGSENGFYIFGGDGNEQPIKHILYLTDDAFDFKTPADVTIKFTFTNYNEKFKEYFSNAFNGAGNPLSITGNFPTVELRNILIPKTVIDGKEANWISFSPSILLKGIKSRDLPEIRNITCDVSANGIIPDAAFFNDTPVDVKKGFYPFGETPKIGDAFYIGCDEAFSKKDANININMNLKGGVASDDLNLSWEYWDNSRWATLRVTDDTINFTKETGNVSFKCPDIMATEINGIQSRWIRVRINKGNYGKPGRYERVKPIAEIIRTVPIPEREIVNIISKVKGDVIKNLTSANITIPTDKIDTIFSSLRINPGSMKDELNTTFLKYAEDIKNQLIENGIISGLIHIPPSYNPPFINSLTIEYSYTNKEIQMCKIYNNFEYQDVTQMPFKPFLQLSGNPTFYIGFEDALSNNPVSLYFSQGVILYGDRVVKINKDGAESSTKAVELLWSYYSDDKTRKELGVSDDKTRKELGVEDDKTWKELGVEDGTDFFSKSGIVKFIIPSDIEKKRNFGKNLYWIRVEIKNGSLFEPPKLKGIFPNTVWAENAIVIKDEVLGSSNGQPHQTFNFSSKPILEKRIIEVKELSIPSEDELEVIEAEEGSDALRIIKNESGDIEEVWVRWHEVKTFVNSKPLSRHYIVDMVKGQIIFGDGIKGMIPPALPNNILAREYKSGGGKKGNQKQGVIKDLKTTIPNIDSVTNYDSSSGGRDLDSIGDILLRAPQSIKNGGRAVTREDFEWLAREASPDVAKARCLKENDGSIKIIIAPAYESDRPVPETSLTDYVERYIKERAFFPLRDNIKVIGPTYKSIGVEVTIVPVSISESAIVSDRVKRRLKEFLHPITGGENKKGWDFGQDIFISEVAAEIEDVEGVDYIKELKVTVDDKPISDDKSVIIVNDDALPCAGEIEIIIKMRGDKRYYADSTA